MKILIRDNKIIGTATEEYEGPEEFISSEEEINIDRYQVVEGKLVVKIPKSVTRRQAKLMLLQQDLLDDVEKAINAIEDEATRGAVQIEWDCALNIHRDWPALQLITKQLGLTDEQLDQMFLLASKI